MPKKSIIGNKILLNPGELIICESEQQIWTVLGSCVSIIFYNRRTQRSAICHAQLANNKEILTCSDYCSNPCGRDMQENDFKYVTCAFKHMLNQFEKAGIRKSEIEVSLYGGASMLRKSELLHIGGKNLKEAKHLIKKNHLRVVNEDTGGTYSRSIILDTKSGEIKLTKIPGSNNPLKKPNK